MTSLARMASFGTSLALALAALDPGWHIRSDFRLPEGTDFGLLQQEFAKRGVRQDYDDDDDAGTDTPAQQKPYTVVDGIAYIYLTGPLTKRQTWLSYYYGGTSTRAVRNLFRQAANDADVRGILLIIDSPGGQAAGTPDLAADIALVSQIKPVLGYIEDMGCSAAYWVGSQCGAGLYCNGNATGGSVGTIMVMVDSSKYYQEMGLEVKPIASGDRKAIGTQGTPITKDDEANLQSYIDSLNQGFLTAVKKARNLNAVQMADVARAGVYVGQDLVKIGLVDGVCSLDEAKQKLAAKIKSRPASDTPTIPAKAETDLPTPSSAAPAPQSETPGAASAAAPDVSSPTGDKPATNVTLRPVLSGGENKMKNALVRVLSALGLNKMAVAVVASSDESPEAMASVLSEQVKSEVDERVSNHPLMMACAASGIQSVTNLQEVLEFKELGQKYRTEVIQTAKKQCIRAYETEMGEKIAAGFDAIPVSMTQRIKQIGESAQEKADADFGIGKDGSAPARQSAPSTLHEAVPADGTPAAAPKSKWEQLSENQRALGLKMGMTTSEKKEQFASEVLAAA